MAFPAWQAALIVALALATSPNYAAEPPRAMPKAEECIDVARLNSVSEAERAVLRIEWRAGLARAEESRLLNEMYERIERMQRTTYDIRVLMNAIPSPSERAAALNSPSGLGPSAVIPPVVAPAARRADAANATNAVNATATLASTTNEAPPPPAAPAPATTNTTATAQPAIAAPAVAEPTAQVAALSPPVTPQAPKAAPAPPIKSAPTIVNDVPEGSLFAFKSVSNFDLAGGGLVFVALVVLWWLRRRSEVSTPAEPDESNPEPQSVPAKKLIAKAEPAASAPVAALVAKDPVFTAPTPFPTELPVTPPQTSADPSSATINNAPATSDPSASLTLPQSEVESAPMEVDATSAMAASGEIDFPLDISTDTTPPVTSDTPTAPPSVITVASPAPVAPLAQVPTVTQSVPAPMQSEESILELAEMMLAMGLATGAAQKLVDHIRDNPKKALAHWLKLLEIYRESGQRSKFEQAAKQLQKEFNIRASDWMRGSIDRPRLEKFDRVYTKTEELWTQPALCIEFLSGILADNRDGTRVGFPQEVAEEILLLIEILKDTSGISES